MMVVSLSERLDLRQMFLGGATAQRDVFAGSMKLVPPPVRGQWPKHQVGMSCGMFRQTYLRAEHGAVEHIEKIARANGVECSSKKFSRPVPPGLAAI
jgi:hypothetical protein